MRIVTAVFYTLLLVALSALLVSQISMEIDRVSDNFGKTNLDRACDVCSLRGKEATSLFVFYQKDGPDTAAKAITAAIALAARHKMKFGGVMSCYPSEYGQKLISVTQEYYGTDQIRFVVQGDDIDLGKVTWFNTVSDMENFFRSGKTIMAHSVFIRDYCVACKSDSFTRNTDSSKNEFYIPQFWEAFRKASALPNTAKKSDNADEFVNKENLDGTCEVCNLGGMKAANLFVFCRKDGLGASANSITAAMALAAKHGMNFGGVMGCYSLRHGQRIISIMQEYYGSDQIPFVAHGDNIDLGKATWFNRVSDMENFFRSGKTIKAHSVLLRDDCVACNLDRFIQNTHLNKNEFYTIPFLEILRKASLVPKIDRQGWPIVALHVRRGDVTTIRNTSKFNDFYTRDDFYYALVEKIKKHLPNAHAHVFSSTEGKYRVQEFDGYKNRGMTLHLDESLSEAWGYFAHADVAILAKSSFSYVPAFLNPNCVIYQKFGHHPLDEWMAVSGTQIVFDDRQLKSCLDRIKQSRKVGNEK